MFDGKMTALFEKPLGCLLINYLTAASGDLRPVGMTKTIISVATDNCVNSNHSSIYLGSDHKCNTSNDWNLAAIEDAEGDKKTHNVEAVERDKPW